MTLKLEGKEKNLNKIKCVFVSAFETLNARSTSLNAVIRCLGVFPFKIFHRVFDPQPRFGLKQLHVASALSFSHSKLVTKDKVCVWIGVCKLGFVLT